MSLLARLYNRDVFTSKIENIKLRSVKKVRINKQPSRLDVKKKMTLLKK